MDGFVLVETLNRSIDYPLVEEVLSVGYYSVLLILATFGECLLCSAVITVIYNQCNYLQYKISRK